MSIVKRMATSVLIPVTMVGYLAAGAHSAALSDTSSGLVLSARSEQGLYDITIRPNAKVQIGVMHSWRIELFTTDGVRFVPTQLVIYGGMPEHRHGLPTQPMVTQQIAEGDYLVEGMLFNMHGSWQLVIGVVGPSGPDKATFNLSLESRSVESGIVPDQWSDLEWRIMQSLAITGEQRPRRDASNRFDGNATAIEFGEALFFDRNLSLNHDISCDSCHKAALKFTDGLRLSVGSSQLARNSPSLLGLSHSEWFYWDGRRDSLWAQALTPIETMGEMDNSRTAVVKYVLKNDKYAQLYRKVAGETPRIENLPDSAGPFGGDEERVAWRKMSRTEQRTVNRVFSNIGKFIASYVATLEPQASRFDLYVKALQSGDSESANNFLTPAEVSGLKLYLDSSKTACLRCHNGPYFTNFGFHNIGTGFDEEGIRDFGRMIGRRAASVDPFKCGAVFSDVTSDECGKHRFAIPEHGDDGAFKVPSLRNVALTAPYMHDGRFEDLGSVLEFYREPPSALELGHELPPLDLTKSELEHLAAFLGALSEAD